MSDDTADLRTGPPLHDALLAVLPLVGTWSGSGTGIAPSGEDFRSASGCPSSTTAARSSPTSRGPGSSDADGAIVRQAWRESGFWRIGPGQDDLEVVLASNTGQALIYTGTAGDQRWEITTASAVPTPTAKVVDAERRLYALVDDELVYVTELAPAGRPLAPHLNARLTRDR